MHSHRGTSLGVVGDFGWSAVRGAGYAFGRRIVGLLFAGSGLVLLVVVLAGCALAGYGYSRLRRLGLARLRGKRGTRR